MGSNVIKSLNAGSGIDTKSLVEGLVNAEKAPKEALLTTRQTKLETQISGYGTLKSALSEFQTAMKPLTEAETFKARAVSFPDTDVITPSKLDANAQTGSFQIEVLDVAQSQSLASDTIDDPDAALGAGELTFRFGAWASHTGTGFAGTPSGFTQNADKESLTIALDADDSLNDLVKKINASDSGLQAAIVKDEGKSKLLLTAPSGANNALEISASDSSAPGLSKFTFNATTSEMEQTQDAKDARLKVNGLEVKRDTNEVSDVIQGLTFSINKANAGEKISFSITEDQATAEKAVRDFVEAYNLLYTTMDNLTSNKSATDENKTLGALRSDGSAKNMMNQLKSMLTGSVAGSDSSFDALTFVGIRTQRDGTLEVNEDDFKKAFADNFDKIGELFAPNYSATNSAISITEGSYVEKAKSGTYSIDVTREPAKGYLHGTANPSATFPLNTGTSGEYSFTISVNGTSSTTITLPDNTSYASEADLAADLQSRINGDEELKKAKAEVDVSFANDRFEFVSREYGASSKIEFTAVGTQMASLGITTSLTGTVGVDVAGTINGEEAFGAGNVLLPKVDSAPYGLNFTIGTGSLGTSSFTYGRGLAGEMSLLIDSFINTSSGSIKTREDSINKEIDGIKEDKKDLDARMVKVEARLAAQFQAMERILTSLTGTRNSLDGLIDRLPFTAKST